MATGFTKIQWSDIKSRDEMCAWHGSECDADTWVPQHRSGRGMGGSKSKNRLSNGITLCSLMNGEIESNAKLAGEARERGIKISLHADPTKVPVTYPDGIRYLLCDLGHKHPETAGGFQKCGG